MNSPDDEFDFFNLNKHQLDDEWIDQPRLYFKHALKLTEARAKVSQLKAELKVVEGDLYAEIIKDPTGFGIEKATVDAVKYTIPTCKAHKKVVAALIEAEREADTYGNVVAALDHRKRALQDLVQLQLSNYWSEPRVKEQGAAREREERDRKAVFGRTASRD